MQIRLDNSSEGLCVLDDGEQTVVHEIRRGAPSPLLPARERKASAKLPRRRVLRTFVRWFGDMQHRFLVPVRIGKVREGWLEQVNNVLPHVEVIQLHISDDVSWVKLLAADGSDARRRAVEQKPSVQEE